jgi:diguanylate cyclase (GGDEF)-like protein
MIKRKPKSLVGILVSIILVAMFAPALVVGWMGYSSAFESIRDEKIRSVGRVADARRDQLVTIFNRTTARTQAFLKDISERCANEVCATEALHSLLTSERALGAVLRLPGGDVVEVGTGGVRLDGEVAFPPGQLARFSEPVPGGDRTYHMVTAGVLGGVRLVMTFPVSLLQDLFVNMPDLGQSGETFLSDPNGFFITKARYPSVQGHSHPISARPMQACLSARDGEVLDEDYRAVEIIHGYRFVPQIGGGCIMAHIDQEEAFAPMRELGWRLIAMSLAFAGVLSLIAVRIARGIIAPVANLTLATREIIAGNYDARAEVTGSNEVSELARSFNRMSERLQLTLGELREHKERLEERVSQRTMELEAVNKTLAVLSISDGLTGLANRRHLDEVLEREWRRAIRASQPISFILLDVDHFKAFNDHYGHQAGDDCLIRIAAVLADHVQRASELAARYGGEEFAIILPETTAADAAALADTVRQAVLRLAIPHEMSSSGVVTISLGVFTRVPNAREGVSTLIAEADKALYRAKLAGRNRLEVAAIGKTSLLQ